MMDERERAREIADQARSAPAQPGGPWHEWASGEERMSDPDDYDHDDYDSEIEPDCLICGGEGFLSGEDMGDPLWYDDAKLYRCYSCGGTGLRKDMTVW